MNYYYLAKFQYDGTGYFGFQWQKDLPTIQNDINMTLNKLIGEKFSTMGASRTDSGVHALEQYVKITTETEIDCSGFVKRLNQNLPPQIRCLAFEPSKKSFRPTNDSISKEYRYFFTNTLKDNCTTRKFVGNNPYPLNFEAMKTCARAIVGENDFHNFVSMGSNVKSTVREISVCEFSDVDYQALFQSAEIFKLTEDIGKCYQLRIVGNGFLKQMIRHLMTALYKVGNGKLTVDEFLELLKGPKHDKRLWKVAHPKGLFLYRILYK